MKYVVKSTWNGTPLYEREHVSFEISVREGFLFVHVGAPYFGDPKPEGPIDRLDGLWDYEVVELFVLGDHERYLEVELGPHGHYLALLLEGARHVVDRMVKIEYTARIEENAWRGQARIPLRYLPARAARGNFNALHGQGARRVYASYYPLGGDTPDFHRLQDFGPLDLSQWHS